MIAIIQINDYHSENAMQVPMNVIQTDQIGSYVYVVRPKDQVTTEHSNNLSKLVTVITVLLRF